MHSSFTALEKHGEQGNTLWNKGKLSQKSSLSVFKLFCRVFSAKFLTFQYCKGRDHSDKIDRLIDRDNTGSDA